MVRALSTPLSELTSWRSDWSGLRVAVLGLGVTGFAVADTLVELGADVLVVAARGSDEHRELLEVIGARFLAHPDDAGVPEELLDMATARMAQINAAYARIMKSKPAA